MHLNEQALWRLLHAEETDLLTASPELRHIEQCPDCRQRLAALSGEGPWLDQLAGELADVPACGQPGPWDAPMDDGDWVSSVITVAIGPTGDCEVEAEKREAEVAGIPTDFLPPALHPELLGRLGRYDVERTIGAGGFGIVFKAYDTELRRVVALKVLAPHLMSSGAARKRFAREAQAAAAIVHEHVIPIYDVVSQEDTCYLVMQYIAGQSLQDRVDRLGPLAVPEVLRIGAQIAAGLRAAHQQGLVHRDVKPANILLEESVDRVLISDFGLARTADDANLTRSGAITGTPHYMSPEQASGLPVDARSDLFSLGSVLYFMCTGRPPFRAPQIMAVLNRICHFPHRGVAQVNLDVPAAVAELIDQLLEKDPEQRPQSADEVQRRLSRLLAEWQSGRLVAASPEAVTAPRNSARNGRLSGLSGQGNSRTVGSWYRLPDLVRGWPAFLSVAGLTGLVCWGLLAGLKLPLAGTPQADPAAGDWAQLDSSQSTVPTAGTTESQPSETQLADGLGSHLTNGQPIPTDDPDQGDGGHLEIEFESKIELEREPGLAVEDGLLFRQPASSQRLERDIQRISMVFAMDVAADLEPLLRELQQLKWEWQREASEFDRLREWVQAHRLPVQDDLSPAVDPPLPD